MVLQGKVAVVTGAAQGLGRGFAEILLKHGARVALLDVNEAAGAELQTRFREEYGADRSTFYCADVSSEPLFREVFQKVLSDFGRVDIFCNNAGIINEKNWEKTISINLGGVVRGAYLALEHMNKEKGGQGGVIVNTASLAGLGPLPTAPIYTATKFGVVGFTRALAAASDLGKYGVRVNALCPSFVRTALIDGFVAEEQSGQFISLKAVSQALMEKFPILEVDHVSKALLVLVKDESLNGACLVVRKEEAGIVSFPKDLEKTPVTL